MSRDTAYANVKNTSKIFLGQGSKAPGRVEGRPTGREMALARLPALPRRKAGPATLLHI